MNHEQKIAWMNEWAAKHGATITLEGQCGFGRECVGLLVSGVYPDYAWLNDDFDRIDNNGDVWTPENAYHKHDCVAVLGRGEEAESQLYEWLRWFDANGFDVETGTIPLTSRNAIQLMVTGNKWARMVKRGTVSQ